MNGITEERQKEILARFMGNAGPLIPDYLHNLEACYWVEERMKSEGLLDRYMETLCNVVANWLGNMRKVNLFDLAHASALQRSESALITILAERRAERETVAISATEIENPKKGRE